MSRPHMLEKKRPLSPIDELSFYDIRRRTHTHRPEDIQAYLFNFF